MCSIRFPVLLLVAAGAVLSARAELPAEAPPRPLTLEAAVSYALAHNPELRRLQQQVAEREGVIMEATARERPTVGATAGYGYTQARLFESLPGFPDMPLPDPNSWQVELSVRRLVYSGGGVEAEVRSAQERTEAARAAVTAGVNAVIYQVEENFLGVLLAREQIHVHEEALQVLQGENERAQVRRTAGAGADFEVLRAEVAIANARPALIRAQNAYRERQDHLRAALGADAGLSEADTDLDVRGNLVGPPLNLALPQAIAAARAHRPELQADVRLIAAAREDIKAAQAARKPQVNLVGGYQYRKASYAASLGDTLNGFTLGAQVDWAIFDGKAATARVRQATAREAQAVAAKDQLRLQIDLEVRDAHRALGESDQLLASAQKVIEQAAESLRLAQTRVAAGTATQLDVLTAQSALTEARSNLSQAQHDYALNAARLRRAMGTSTSP
jgi:outer membrane protein TolC